FKTSGHSGYFLYERRYLERYAFAPLSPLSANGPQVLLIAERDGKPVFRALAGADMRYNRLNGSKTGYFSLFDGEKDKEAAQAILDAVFEKQRAWGMGKVIGPVSPDGSGFFMGAGEGDFEKKRGIFTGPDSSFQARILRENGFDEVQSENAFEITVNDKNPLSEITRKAEKRFRIEIANMRTGLLCDRWIRDILSVSKDAPEKDMRLLLERIRPFIDKKFSYSAYADGVCAGYLVSLKPLSGIHRAATLITGAGHFSAPVVLSLIGRYLTDIESEGIRTIEVSVINYQNIRSERLVLRYGGKKVRSYTLFTKNVR
ncbi:MAG: hypothetical protein IIW08_08500, partial [Clostridia bacterium]|nr:hypothetical protein [Clostridia bacterium]